MKRFALLLVAIASALAIGTWTGAHLQAYGAVNVNKKPAFRLKEPLLIEGEQQNYHSLLPAGTVLYMDKSWPEGHETFHVYFHFKGNFEADAADAGVVSPLWLRTVERDDLGKLLSESPVSKDDLVRILKARKMTREDLADIVREWTD